MPNIQDKGVEDTQEEPNIEGLRVLARIIARKISKDFIEAINKRDEHMEDTEEK